MKKTCKECGNSFKTKQNAEHIEICVLCLIKKVMGKKMTIKQATEYVKREKGNKKN